MNRWITRTILGVFAVTWFVAAFIYLKSQQVIKRTHVPEPRRVSLVTGDELLVEGERLARVFGCADGCHGDKMQGAVVFEHPLNGRFTAPNLTQLVQNRTVDEIEAVLRQGIKPDGGSVFVMPSAALAAMTDRDFSAIYSYLRNAPYQTGQPEPQDHGILTRYRMVTGALPAEAERRITQPWRETFRDNEMRLGEYLASVACAQCHGLDLEGVEGGAPSLRKVVEYDRFEFGRLLEAGAGMGEREVGLMSEVARKRFRHLTEEEVEALYAYLKTRP